MSRFICLSIAVVLSLSSVTAQADPAQKKPAHALKSKAVKSSFKGYGFLPGYRQPLNNALPLFKQEASVLRNARREKRHWYIDRLPVYYRWSDGEKYYYGRPGFYRGKYNGGSMGPCWTQTPIGPVWNCG